ncbi:DUF4145 domain-containing protein [Pseudomonas sp.]|uniref:DUF4145 domain-containing protein n=1 Tax=Pseudomonas sp. TaxID=306 RepID=UPI003D119004
MFERSVWEKLSRFNPIDDYPVLPCPYCNGNALRINKDTICFKPLSGESLKNFVDKFSSENFKNAEGGGEFIKFLAIIADASDLANYKSSQFIAFFDCALCSGSVSSLGVARIPIKVGSKGAQLKVECFNPPVPMFSLSPTTPKKINEELLGAFRHFHSDVGSAGNKLRRAMEQLCVELGYGESNLHRNIIAMSKDYPEESNWLGSLKLVGNEATHSNGVIESDILDFLQVFDVVLDIFRRREASLKIRQTVEKIDDKFKKY